MTDLPEPSTPPAATPADSPTSPYRDLWVPLIVVPALIVLVIVLVWVFFGTIGGSDSTLEENLDRAVHGGANESQQAAASLASQVVKNYEAVAQGLERPFKAGPEYRSKLEAAWKELEESGGNPNIRFVVAQALAEQGDEQALDKLASLLRVPDEEDSQGALRFNALLALSRLHDPRAAVHVIPFLRHSDPYLRQGAAMALQSMPSPESAAALRGVLDDPSLELRGMAAISLTHLGDPSGAPVLRELIRPGTYAAIRAAEPDSRKYADPKLVQSNRVTAVRALARLGLSEDRALFEELSKSDADPAVREAAMRGLD
jgi:HEAT repeat protein